MSSNDDDHRDVHGLDDRYQVVHFLPQANINTFTWVGCIPRDQGFDSDAVPGGGECEDSPRRRRAKPSICCVNIPAETETSKRVREQEQEQKQEQERERESEIERASERERERARASE
jgi:hypothetical protein